ncbi:MAG: nitroreductase family deazaflavin-dependent oxidoreductase [Chloroflexi bacterium]|nr:nitroreductase family deazaflavin-dependent oxidoreductase [Chloroflexota bacterium]
MASSEPTFTRPRASPLLRALLKIPSLVYRGPLADLMRSRCVLLLTTRGRRSGRPRTGAVSFMPLGEHFVVFSGWGVRSNWFRNVRANPDVMVTVGRRRMRATARLVEDPERRRELMRGMQARSSGCGPPQPLRPLLKLARMFDYQGEIDMAIAAGGSLPVVEIIPN